MSRAATPGETYRALVSASGHSPDSPWVTVLGSYWGVKVDPEDGYTGGRVYTTQARVVERQERLPEGSAGKPLEIAQVDYCGSGHFKRHVTGSDSAPVDRGRADQA